MLFKLNNFSFNKFNLLRMNRQAARYKLKQTARNKFVVLNTFNEVHFHECNVRDDLLSALKSNTMLN